MADYDPLSNSVLDFAKAQLNLAHQLIREDFPQHSGVRVEQFVMRAFHLGNHSSNPEHSFDPDRVAAAYRAAHPNESPAPRNPAPPAIAPEDKLELIYDWPE